MTTVEELNKWLQDIEGSQLEFKAARNSYSKDKDLPDYCAAIANEGGGKLILGIDDSGKVIGTKVFPRTYNSLPHHLLQIINLRVDVSELQHPEGRVLIFHIPSHSRGHPVKSRGRYLMRAGESLVEMDAMTLRRILTEAEPDFSSGIIPSLGLQDLDLKAIRKLKQLWATKVSRKDFLKKPDRQMLNDLELATDDGLNYAALIVLGKEDKIAKHLPDAEIIFEWRQEPAKTSYDFRKTWRGAFLNIYDEIWNTISARNLRIPFQQGFIQREILAFDEKSIREALMNAVTHRDYSLRGRSVFIKASPEEIQIESPGGFVAGVTSENALTTSAWRNRRLAEIFGKAGLVERSGQGLDDIFEKTIRDGKGMPDLSCSDNIWVRLKIPAKVQDEKFILYLERMINEKQILLSFEEIYELEKIREFHKAEGLKFKDKLLSLGLIEKVGRGRGIKCILSHHYYAHIGKVGVHTRISGISREKQKELILKHLSKNKKGFLSDFQDVFPELKPMSISNLLQELKREGRIVHRGPSKSGYWQLV